MCITTWTLLDFFGSAFSLLSIYLFTKANRIGWFFSITATSISVYLYYLQKMYGYCGLGIFSIISSIYGYYRWTYKGLKRKELPISRINAKTALYTLLFITITSIVLPWLFKTYTDHSMPILDGINVALCLAALFLSVNKILETWILWLFVNFVKIALHGLSGNIFHAITHIVSIGLNFTGFKKWKMLYLKQTHENNLQ